MSKQPDWKFIANLGDVNPVEYDGYFVFQDNTGVYPPELEFYDSDHHKAYRVILEPLCVILPDMLVPCSIAKQYFENPYVLPHNINEYIVWFAEYLEEIASFIGVEKLEIVKMFCSNNPADLAEAYRALYEYHGWDNGDSYPLELTEYEAHKRYDKYLK